MPKLKHTRYGWFDKDRAPYISQDASTKNKTLRLAPLPKEGRCCLPHSVSSLDESDPMTLAECLLLLANISLGLRSIVLHGQSRYIDRWEKTFFREHSPMPLSLSQDSVYRLSSLANYVHIRRIDRSRGVIEALYEEYLFVCGQLAYSLLEASRRYQKSKDAELVWQVGSRRHNLYTQDVSKRTASVLSDKMTAELAMNMVEGAMCSCALRDRTATQKDSDNKQLRAILGIYDGIELDMDTLIDKNALVGIPLTDYLVALSQAPGDEFWLVRAEEDGISSSRKWASKHPRSRFKELV